MASGDALELRTIDPAEIPGWVESVSIPFLDPGNHEHDAHWEAHLEPERAWAVWDRGRVVANCCVFSRDVTVPAAPGAGCPAVPFAAVSGVGVHPTHRRRGLLARMMAAMVDDGRERGEPFAGLFASEGSIYARFGFGIASFGAGVRVATGRSAFARQPPPMEMTLVPGDGAAKMLPALHDRIRRCRPGEVNRNDARWADEWADARSWRHGASAAFRVVTAGGFVCYRIAAGKTDGIEANRAVIYDLYGEDPATEAALWQFMCNLDLVTEVEAHSRPVDDPLRWWLADPRQVRTTAVTDRLWVRPLDVPATLTARGYRRAGRLVLEVLPAPVTPPGGDPAAGRYVLDASPDGANCRRARGGEEPEVILGVAELGSLYLGGVPASVLSAAGRVAVAQRETLALIDDLFATDPAPFAGTSF